MAWALAEAERRPNRALNSVKPHNADPPEIKNPEPIDIKLDGGDYIGDLTPHANFGISTLMGRRGCKCMKLSLSVSFLTPVVVYFLVHLHRSHH